MLVGIGKIITTEEIKAIIKKLESKLGTNPKLRLNFESISAIGSFLKKSFKNAEKSTSEKIKTEIKVIKFTSSDLNPIWTKIRERSGKKTTAETKEIENPKNSKNCDKNPRLKTNAA